MLAPPGHSPRHIEPPSPSPSALTFSSQQGLSKPPLPASRKRKPEVLDEDTYVNYIERIIERDFFPDIPKLQNRLEWMEAVRSGDPELIRDAQLRIIRRRAETKGVATPAFQGTPFATPASVMPGVFPAPTLSAAPVGAGGAAANQEVLPPLDEFLQKYTSEDNASFNKILEKVNKKREEKYAYLKGGEEGASARLRLTQGGDGKQLGLQGPEAGRPTDGFGSSNQSEDSQQLWDYKAKSALMYFPAGNAELTSQELQERTKGPPKEVNRSATRFHASKLDPSGALQSQDGGAQPLAAMLATPHLPGETPGPAWPFADRRAEQAKKRYDLEDLRRTPLLKDSPRVAGYGFVATPSPAPGVDESPFMTWGDIEGTPMRLEAEDTPLDIGGTGDGPQFKIPAPPVRDKRAHEMSRKAASNLKARQEATGRSPAPGLGLTTPSPARGGATPGGGLSAAAQKLMSAARAKSAAGVDMRLRASYRASPGPGGRTPSKIREGSVERTPYSAAGTPLGTPVGSSSHVEERKA